MMAKHYADSSHQPFFPDLVKYMSSGPVVPMAWEGLHVVKTARKMLGTTNLADSMPGTIRADLCNQVWSYHDLCCHGSDTVESAAREIALWFRDDELVHWTLTKKDSI